MVSMLQRTIRQDNEITEIPRQDTNDKKLRSRKLSFINEPKSEK